MWRQHDRRWVALLDHPPKLVGLAGKARQRIGIQYRSRVRLESCGNHCPHALADAAAWAKHDHVAPLIPEEGRQPRGAIDLPDHDGDALGGMGGNGTAW